jgi:hypothetical protein
VKYFTANIGQKDMTETPKKKKKNRLFYEHSPAILPKYSMNPTKYLKKNRILTSSDGVCINYSCLCFTNAVQ